MTGQDQIAPNIPRAQALAAQTGGFYRDVKHHVVAWLPQGHRRLVVTFDNLTVLREGVDRMPWGYEFLAAQDWDVLGIMVKRLDWYRHNTLWDVFDDLRDSGFFAQYEHVAMYGASMGAYGALAFAPAAPGCTVLAMAPQSTLDRAVVPFDTRYKAVDRIADWTGRYSDAATGVRSAARAYVVFDPLLPEDAAHAARIAGDNVVQLRLPAVGHKIPPALKKMGLLKPLCERALVGELALPEFNRMYRARRTSVPWIETLLIRAQQANHFKLGVQAAESAMARQPHWKIRGQLKELRRAATAARTPEIPKINNDTDPI